MGITLDGVYNWTFLNLDGDAVLKSHLPAGVHRGSVPQALNGPALVMELYTGTVHSVLNGITLYEELVLTIKAIGQKSDWNAMVAGFNRAHALLHRASGTGRGDVAILFCQYITPVQYPEVQYGISFENLGGRFRYTAQAQ